MKITKSSGEQQNYSGKKLAASLKASGASKDLANKVLKGVEKSVSPGMTTREIEQKTRALLLKESPAHAARYSLKRGIMELGPSGYLFEQYVAALLREYGYQTATNRFMKGESGVVHEIDVLAQTKDTHYILEAKYRNSRGRKTDVTVAMYVFAKLLDIEGYKSRKESQGHKSWVVTNTRFTTSAIKYGSHKGMKLTGWKYPKKESLENIIEKKRLYPPTVLPSVNRYAKERFGEAKLYFAKDLVSLGASQLKKRFGIQGKIAENIQREAKELCE